MRKPMPIRGRRHLIALLAALLAAVTIFALGLMFQANPAEASDTLQRHLTNYEYGENTRTGSDFGNPDSNRFVPEYRAAANNCYDGVLARTHYYVDTRKSYGPYVMYIAYDFCEMRRLGYTRAGIRAVRQHERAHARGFAHYEGSPRYNAAYYPSVKAR